jgi:hypothetical protein
LKKYGMDQSKLRLVLRFLLAALLVVTVLAIGLIFLSEKLLPEPLAEWFAAEHGGEFEWLDFVAMLFSLGMLALFFVSIVGLFCYQRWAGWLMAGVVVVSSLQLIASPTVEPGIVSYLGSLSDLLTGLVLGVVFFTDALDETRAG